MNQEKTPLFNKLMEFQKHKPISLHVPGHKNGTVIPTGSKEIYQRIMSIDMTELNGLDDLHAPEGIIAEAQDLASDYFQSQKTFFLIGGSTVGNLAMILATCGEGDKVIIQRNCHKSVWNGLELSGATPILVSPAFDNEVGRYTVPNKGQLIKVINQNPEARAILLTYPDYFGRTYDLKPIIEAAHEQQIAVLIDEAHGVHFSIPHSSVPKSALELGADAVVQSAHKMAPAMTMTAFLHIGLSTKLLNSATISHYLAILQSSSPSYPLLASLDTARHYLATRTTEDIDFVLNSVLSMRSILATNDVWKLLPFHITIDDPLKITIEVRSGYDVNQVIRLFEENHIYAELQTENQILFIHGLEVFNEWRRLKTTVEKVTRELKINEKHATIEKHTNIFPKQISSLHYSYKQMKELNQVFVSWEESIGKVAAQHITPYPPGIPIIGKGEVIEVAHVHHIKQLLNAKIKFQQHNIQHIQQGLYVFL